MQIQVKIVLMALFLTGWFNQSVLAETATNAPAAKGPVVIPQSFFDNPSGNPVLKDPFFPRTKRQPYGSPVIANPVTPTEVDPYAGLKMTGILGNGIISINYKDMGAGETRTIRKQDGTPVELKLLEIKESSIVIQAKGFPPKELRMK